MSPTHHQVASKYTVYIKMKVVIQQQPIIIYLSKHSHTILTPILNNGPFNFSRECIFVSQIDISLMKLLI